MFIGLQANVSPIIIMLYTFFYSFQSAETSPWLKGNQISDNIINDLQTLFSFAKWKRDNYDSLPKHDHAALYTGLA